MLNLKRPSAAERQVKREPVMIEMMRGGGCVVTHGKLPERPVERATIRLPLALLADLKREAKRRGVDRDALAVAILRNIIADNLFAAVLDR